MSAADPPSRRAAALGAVGIAVLTWSASNVVIKMTTVTGLVASFWRLWMVVPLLWAVLLGTPSIRRRLGRRFRRASLVGGTHFGVHQILFFTALKTTSVATVSVLGALQPALVLLVSGPLFGERVDGRTIACTLVALAGTAVVVVGGTPVAGETLAGDAVAVLNLVVFTTYVLASKQLREGVGAIEYVGGLTTVAAVVVGVACVVHGERLDTVGGRDWGWLAFIALVPGTLGHLLVNWAHAHAPAMITSLLLLGVPVLSTAGAAVVLGEPVTGLQIAGGAAALGAVGWLVVAPKPRQALAEAVAGTDAP
jgi:drug/metabolite transporter (DMT)-like permease